MQMRRGSVVVLVVLLLLVAVPWAQVAGLFHEPAVLLGLIVVGLAVLARWKRSREIGIAAVTAWGLFLWVVFFAPGSLFGTATLHVENFDRIHYGTPIAEVEELLGGRPGNYGRYTGPGFQTMEGYDGPSGSEIWLWADDSHQLEVAVLDEHAVGTHERAAYGRERTFVNRLRRIFEFRRIGPPSKLERHPRRARAPGPSRPLPTATPSVKELPVPVDKPVRRVALTECRPKMTTIRTWFRADRSLVGGPGGEVWFVGEGRIGHITSRGSVWPSVSIGGAQPRSGAAGPDGALWFTDDHAHTIRRAGFDRSLRTFPLPTRSGAPGPDRGPAPNGITLGPDGALWFVESSADKLGRITTDGKITEIAIPRGDRYHLHPEDVTTGTDGALWFTQLYTDEVGRYDPETKRFSTLKVPVDKKTGLGPRSIHTAAGKLWITLTPDTVATIDNGTVKTERIRGATALGAVAEGSDGNVWVVDAGRIVAMRPDGSVVRAVRLPDASEPRVGQHGLGRPDSIVTGPDGALWIALPNAGHVARYGCPPS